MTPYKTFINFMFSNELKNWHNLIQCNSTCTLVIESILNQFHYANETLVAMMTSAMTGKKIYK